MAGLRTRQSSLWEKDIIDGNSQFKTRRKNLRVNKVYQFWDYLFIAFTVLVNFLDMAFTDWRLVAPFLAR